MADPLLLTTRNASETLSNSSLHAAVIGTSVTCMILVSVFTSARLVAKRSVSSFTIEDYLLMFTWPMLLGFTVAFMVSANYGVGDHVWNVPSSKFEGMQKSDYVIDIFYALTTWCGKTALLFQMQRIFSPSKSGVVYVSCYLLAASIAATYSVVTLALVLQCIPVKKIWDPTVTGGHCLDEAAMSIATGVINVVTDFLILALPMWAIHHLKMPLKRKFTVYAIFATGLIACACSLCRMIYAFQIIERPDFTYSIAKLGISAVCEITSIILCTCFPLMPRFVQVCKSTERGSQIFSAMFPRSSRASSDAFGEKTMIDDSCVFCDKNASCAIHEASSDFSVDYAERDSGFDKAATGSGMREHRDSEATQVGDDPERSLKSGSIMVSQRFEVAHGVQLNDNATRPPGL